MLSYWLIIVALQLTVANGFLQNCPIKETQRIDDDSVADVLRTFYNDLTKVRGITELWSMTKANEKYTDEHTTEGMRLLEDINKFVWDVDWNYGIKKSPNLTLLAEVHNSMKDQVSPWQGVRDVVFNMGAQRAKYFLDDEEDRIGPNIRGVREPSIRRDTVDGIMCELVEKLKILGVCTDRPAESTEQPRASTGPLGKVLHRKREQVTDYSDIIGQLELLDPDYAKQLYNSVVKYVGKDDAKALKNAEDMHKQLNNPDGPYDFRETFTRWFMVEFRRKSTDRCKEETMDLMDRDVSKIRYIRSSRKGVSIGRMIEMEAKVLFLTIQCFHNKLEQVK